MEEDELIISHEGEVEVEGEEEIEGEGQVDNSKTIDLISRLPDHILSCILSFLNMREAAKMRVLSPGWRYLCASTSNLNFDICTLFGIKLHSSYLYALSDYSLKFWEDKFKFVRAVDQFLQLYKSQKIHSFKVCYCLGNESAFHIDAWVSFAVKMQTEIIDLDFSAPPGHDLYNFPCHLLSPGKASPLKHLHLKACLLRPSPDFANLFYSLKTLDLASIPLEQTTFNEILSDCISLEWVRFQHCLLPNTFLVCGPFPSLKSLIFDNYRQGAHEIRVSTINLIELEYSDSMDDFSFVDVLSLKKLHLDFSPAYERTRSYIYRLAEELPQLQALSLSFTTKRVHQIPANMTKFSHLKELELMVHLSTDFDLCSIAFFLNAAPCLQKFHLALQEIRDRGKMVKRECPKHLHYQLKEIEISGFDVSGYFLGCNALDLAKHLISTAVELKRMIVNYERRCYKGAGRWHTYSSSRLTMRELEKKCLSVVKKRTFDVLSQEKASANVELIVL